MHFEESIKVDFSDVLLKPKRSTIESRADVELKRMFKFKYGKRSFCGIPIISSNMSSVTNEKVAGVMKDNQMLACLPKNQYKLGNPFTIYSMGLKDNSPLKDLSWFNYICLDVPNGYMQKFVDYVNKVRNTFQEQIIIAGNVVSAEMTEALILAGADVVKVGIGSGSACATRLKTGVGYPQLSAVIECADAAHGLGGHIVSDGGCVHSGDVAKAFAAGADFVMLGGMLAGHDENGSDFYGMSSVRANHELTGKFADYKAAEGFEMKLPSRGPLQNTLNDICGGLRSACAYVGAKTLKDLPKCATFVKVNHQVNTSLWEHKL